MRILCLLLSLLVITTAAKSAVSQTADSHVSVNPSPSAGKEVPVGAATEGQIREFFRISGTETVYRQRLLDSIDSNRSKGEPYWPEDVWDDLKKVMQNADLVGLAVPLYRRHISEDMIEAVNDSLKTMSLSDLASTPTGSKFCEIQRSMDAEGRAIMLNFTQHEFQKVYERHNSEIKAARAKYLAAHPDWKD